MEDVTQMSGLCPIRMTPQTQLVLLLLLQDTNREWYGLEIADRLSLRPSLPGEILGRLHRVGWVTRRVEHESPITLRRAQRHYYRLTEAGAMHAQACLAAKWSLNLVGLATACNLSINPLQHASMSGDRT